jgi:hypothetical protein
MPITSRRTAGVDAVGDHERLVAHGVGVGLAHPLDARVEPDVGIGALERPAAEGVCALVQALADAADRALGDPLDPELLHQPLDLAGADALHVGLHHHRQQGLLGSLARLEEARQVAGARAQLGDLELERPHAGVEASGAVAVAVGGPLLAALVVLAAGQAGHLQLHHLGQDQGDALAQEVGVLGLQHLAELGAHAETAGVGHRGSPRR